MDTYTKTVEILQNKVFFKGEDITIKIIANAITDCNVFFADKKDSLIYELVPKRFDIFMLEQLNILDTANNAYRSCNLCLPYPLNYEINIDYKVINKLLYRAIKDIDKIPIKFLPFALNFIIINYTLGRLTFKEIKTYIEKAINGYEL